MKKKIRRFLTLKIEFENPNFMVFEAMKDIKKNIFQHLIFG